MAITSEYLLFERPRDPYIGGVQRVYRFPSGFGLSAVNGAALHSYPFAWEIAVLKDVSEDGKKCELTYDTPLTEDVEVFGSDNEANEFINRAIQLIGGRP